MAKKKISPPGYINVTSTLMTSAIKIYSTWKKLDAQIDAISTRGINFPGELSEIFACYVLKYQWKKDGHGDAFDPVNKRIIEVKGSGSHKKDLSSFSPSESFAELIFVKVDKDEDKAYIYETGVSSDDLKLIQVNTTENVGNQQAANRRPLFSIESKIIAKKGLTPSYELDIMAKTITKLK
jgi:hypothetical protein